MRVSVKLELAASSGQFVRYVTKFVIPEKHSVHRVFKGFMGFASDFTVA